MHNSPAAARILIYRNQSCLERSHSAHPRTPALQRPEPTSRCGLRLTPRDAEIIHAVCTYRALTAPQINKLFFPGESEQHSQTVSSRCQYRLKLLFQHGYLFRDAPPTKYNEGRKPLVYFLDRAAIALLTAQVIPVLLLSTEDGVRNAMYLADMPDDGDKKLAYFHYIGEQLRSHNMKVAEAVFISEAWTLTGLDGRTGIMPSLHPKRVEAIVIVGRNAANTRMSCVVQPFAQSKKGKPVWEKVTIAYHNEPVSKDLHCSGLLDNLFEALDKK